MKDDLFLSAMWLFCKLYALLCIFLFLSFCNFSLFIIMSGAPCIGFPHLCNERSLNGMGLTRKRWCCAGA